MNNAALSASKASIAGHYKEEAAFLAFNRLPSSYLHRSWRAAFATANVSDFLFESAFNHKLLSDFLRLENELDDIDFADSLHPAVRIGMHLDEHQLQVLCRRIGVALIGQPLRLAISSKEIAAWIAALGEPLFHFACRYAPLLNGASFLTAVSASPLLTDTVAERMTVVGQQFLHAGSLLIDASIGQRLRFRLPRELSDQADIRINPTHYSEVWTWIERILNCMPMPVSRSPMQTTAAYR
jgi:hypothetical protein